MRHPKVMLTGLQPSGTLHIGNYFGAVKPYIDMIADMPAEECVSFLMVADYHALTSVRDRERLRIATREIVRDYLAYGVDVKKMILFRQSENPDHLELAWIFNCLVSVPFLQQAHAYKDKVARGLEANVGLFTYPMLMAADIVLYDTDIVPVGEDQRQHIEYTREAVAKFNNAYGEILKAPQEYIMPSVSIVPGLDGQKMSKSYGNTIPMFATKDELAELVKKIVTDSSGDRPENVFRIHSLLKPAAELEALYDEHRGQYKVLKDALTEDLEEFMAPLRDARSNITDAMIDNVLEAGKQTAQEKSAQTMQRVREAIGITI